MDHPEKEIRHPLVAIICLVYNQENFLRNCLEGFVMQQTNFPFVAIVHDDASTDGSANIIREYEAKYPHIFKPIYQTENQYSKPGVSVMRIASAAAKENGVKYIAMCEGDDYWTDPKKLQRQVDFLETHSDYSLTTENATRLYLHTHKSEPFSRRLTGDIQIDELILTRQFATASVLYRIESLQIPQNIKTYDTLLWCLLAQNGKIHYQDIVSSVYRIGDGVTKKDKIKWAYQIIDLNQSLFSVIKVNKKTKYIHNKELLAILLDSSRDALRRKQYKNSWVLLLHGLKLGIIPWLLLIHQIITYKLFNTK